MCVNVQSLCEYLCDADAARIVSANTTHAVVGVALAGRAETLLEIRFAQG